MAFPSCTKCGSPFCILCLPRHQSLVDIILNQSLYGFADGPKDTSPDDTLEKTYVPSLKTLEEEVMEKLGIQEKRRPRTSYWY